MTNNNNNLNTQMRAHTADLIEVELQYLLLIPDAFKSRGYGVKALPDTDAVNRLVRGERLEWFKGTSKVTPFDLEQLLGEKEVTALVVITEYLAICNPGNGHLNIAPHLRNFIVGNGVIFVQSPVTGMPAEMGYREFYNCITK